MSNYGELDPMVKHRRQFASKARENIYPRSTYQT